MSRPRVLSDEQASELRELYALGRANTPGRLARRFGITTTTLQNYVAGRHKRRWHKVDDAVRELVHE